MSAKLVVADALSYASAGKNTRGIRTTIEEILRNIKAQKKSLYYSDAAPNLDFSLEYGKSSSIVAEACGAIWEYCKDTDLPWFNMLIVSKSTGLPSEGVQNWYINKFGSLAEYKEYCETHQHMCLSMLNKNLVEII